MTNEKVMVEVKCNEYQPTINDDPTSTRQFICWNEPNCKVKCLNGIIKAKLLTDPTMLVEIDNNKLQEIIIKWDRGVDGNLLTALHEAIYQSNVIKRKEAQNDTN